MLDINVRSRLKTYLRNINRPVEIVASLDSSETSKELIALLREIVALTDQVSVIETQQGEQRKPSFSIGQVGTASRIQFAATPTGPEFSSLVLALLQVGGHPLKEDDMIVEQLQTLQGDYDFETYISLSCESCVDVVQALNMIAVINPRIRHVTIDGGMFQHEVEARQITVVPTIYLNGEVFGEGRSGFRELAARLYDIEMSMNTALRAAGRQQDD